MYSLLQASYSCSAFRKTARAVTRALPRIDLAVSSPAGTIHTDSPDRLLAALFWKYRLDASLEYSVYTSMIKPGMTVLDIGANIGFLTLLFSRLAGGTGKVIAIEPDPDNFRLLQKNVAVNGLANVNCENMAAAKEYGTIKLFRSEEHRGDHRVFDSGDGRSFIEVRAATVDSLTGPGGKADFIKMDIQGAEIQALEGMQRTLRNSPGARILCEFSPSLLRKSGSRPEALLYRFLDLGFRIKYLDERSFTVKEAGAPQLLAMCPGDRYLNLLIEK